MFDRGLKNNSKDSRKDSVDEINFISNPLTICTKYPNLPNHDVKQRATFNLSTNSNLKTLKKYENIWIGSINRVG
jgi:hypothetical protein